MKTVILAGGLGTRLQPYTTFLPKPMLPLGEKPILEYIIEWNKKNGIKDIVLCVSYLRRTIEDYFEDGREFGVNIEYAVATRPLATAGQLKTAEEFVDDTFVCMYGDSIFDFNLRRMVSLHKKRRADITIGTYEYKTKLAYGVIETKADRVTAWNEKPDIVSNINTGCYVFEPSVFRYIPKSRLYGMDDLVRKAISRKERVYGHLVKGQFIDIGDKASYKEAYQKFLAKLGKI